MFIGQKVKILPCKEYRYAGIRREGQEGEIREYDPTDDSYWVAFEDKYTFSWYSPDEFEVVNPEITTVGQAIDFLVKAGYKVTIEKE